MLVLLRRLLRGKGCGELSSMQRKLVTSSPYSLMDTNLTSHNL